MSQGKIIKHLATNPKAMMDFQARGRLPKFRDVRETPLLRLLKKISPRTRVRIRGVKLGSNLGYHCDQIFDNAELLFKWLGGYGQIGDWETLPSESMAIQSFGKSLSLNDLKEASRSFPEKLVKKENPHFKM